MDLLSSLFVNLKINRYHLKIFQTNTEYTNVMHFPLSCICQTEETVKCHFRLVC